jgi:hypothetical protein
MADDIKIKLGLDIGSLFVELQRAITQLNSLIVTASRTENALENIDGQKVDIDTTPAQSSLSELEQQAEKTSKNVADTVSENFSKASGSSSGIMAGFVGGLTTAGVGAAIEGVRSLGSAIYQGALSADDFGDKLEVAFSQQGIADVDGEINKVRESTLSLANSLGLPVERTRELAGTVATLGGVSGQQAEDLTKLSAGIETFTDGTVKGEAVVKAFSRGLADPEGAAAIESLSKKYPQLAETLKSNIDPAQKLAEANKILGTSFETVAAQQGDAGGALNTLSNFATEAFETIGSSLYDILNEVLPIFIDGFKEVSTVFNEVFGSTEGSTTDFLAIIKEVAQIVTDVLVTAFVNLMTIIGPIINFIVNNFSTIAPIIGVAAAAFAAYNLVVGIGTAVTTAYGAVQTALGGSISIATAAQYAWNLAMSLNPIGAVVAGLAVLAAGVYAVTDALSVSAEEARETAEANVELIETQKQANEEQTKTVQSTKTMADEFIKLSEKKKLTNAETAKMKELTKNLSKEYPDLVKNTSSYKENLSGVQSIANQAGTSLNSLAQESARLDRALQASNQTLAFAKRNEAIQEAQSLMKTFGVVTDSYGLSAVNAFSQLLYQADTVDKATAAYEKARRELGNNAKALSVVGTAYQQQIAALNAFKKTTEDVIDTNNKLNTGGGGGGSKGGRTAAADASEFKKASDAYSDYLDEIETKRKEAIDKFEDQGLNKEEIQVKLSEDPSLSPKAEEVRAKIKELFMTTYDDNGNLQLGVKFGKDEDKGDATRNIRKLIADADKFEIKLKAGISSKPADFKELIKSLEELTKDAATNAQIIVPVDGVNTKKALDQVTNDTLKYVDFVKSQNDEIAQAQAEALAAGNTEQAAQFATLISNNNQSISLIEERLKRFKEKSQKAIEDNQIQNQIGIALQTSILDVFNSERLRKEKETNDQIRAERLGALDAEENDLTSSLAKREISFEEFAAKMSEIDKNRQAAMESTEVTFAERLKEVQDKTIGSILRNQSVAITGFVTDQFKDAEGNISETGKVAGDAMTQLTTQFAQLAESGKATLGDFGKAAAAVAFDAVSKMIPSFVAGILGSSITALGPIAGPIAAGLLTASLQLLIGQAKASLGFKDGVVDLAGPGTETSDSIPAWLSKGESVITASSTRANKDELAWMNANPGMSIRDYFMASSPAVRYAVSEDGDLIKEVRKLREETRGLGRQINRNTHVEISGELKADNNSIKAMIDSDRRRNARRG